MTQLTNVEIKIVYFQLCLGVLMGILFALYANEPIQKEKYNIETSVSPSVSGVSSSWITQLIDTITSKLPPGYGDLALVSTIFLSPLIAMDIFIAIRVTKDLITQWV